MDKINKLSDAIRLGATFRPQCRIFLFMNGESCAVGAGAEAAGFPYDEMNQSRIWAFMRQRFKVTNDLLLQITRLNDLKGWTREAIADWLAEKGY